MTLPITGLPSWEGQVATPWTPVNETHAGLEQYAQIVVQSMALTTPPSATEGEAYIPAATATGAWAGLEDDLVYYLNGGWETIPLQSGVVVYNLADSTLYVKTSGSPTFQELASAGGSPVDSVFGRTGAVVGAAADYASVALQVSSLEVGHASDTTLSRTGAGVLAVEGVEITTNTGTQTLTNKTLTSPTINGGTIQSRVQVSSETTGALTSASANKTVVCTGGVTLDNSVFTAGDIILLDSNGSNRTITRGSGVTMYLDGVNSATATLAADQIGIAYYRSASVVVLAGAFS